MANNHLASVTLYPHSKSPLTTWQLQLIGLNDHAMFTWLRAIHVTWKAEYWWTPQQTQSRNKGSFRCGGYLIFGKGEKPSYFSLKSGDGCFTVKLHLLNFKNCRNLLLFFFCKFVRLILDIPCYLFLPYFITYPWLLYFSSVLLRLSDH